jgi:hypothetical protein
VIELELYTSHWRNRELAELDTSIIGISRGTPRGNPGFRYKVLRSLAPSKETFAIEDRNRFEAAYTAQLEELGIECILAELVRIGGGRPGVLLCWERPEPGEWCHRWTLSGWIEEQSGIVVPELRPGMLAKRPDAPQQALF